MVDVFVLLEGADLKAESGGVVHLARIELVVLGQTFVGVLVHPVGRKAVDVFAIVDQLLHHKERSGPMETTFSGRLVLPKQKLFEQLNAESTASLLFDVVFDFRPVLLRQIAVLGRLTELLGVEVVVHSVGHEDDEIASETGKETQLKVPEIREVALQMGTKTTTTV